MLNGSVIYVTNAADWKGQANSIGPISPEQPPAPPIAVQPCGAATLSGAGSSTNVHDLGSVGGMVTIEYATVKPGGTAANMIEAFCNGNLVATTHGLVIVEEGKEQSISFLYNPAIHTDKKVTVKVTAAVESVFEWWWYKVNCPVPVPTPPPAQPPAPPTCNSAPEICQIYRELFNRNPDEGGAQFWLNYAQSQNINFKTASGYNQLKLIIRNSAGNRQDCETAGGVWNAAKSTCSFP